MVLMFLIQSSLVDSIYLICLKGILLKIKFNCSLGDFSNINLFRSLEIIIGCPPSFKRWF